MASLPSPAQVAGKHNAIFEAYYKQMDPKGLNVIEAMDAAKFLKKSGLGDVVLSRIWDLSDPKGRGCLDKHGFFVALKFISLAQARNDINMRNILMEVANPPKVGEIPKIIPQAIQTVPPTNADWSIKPNDRLKYETLFESLQPVDGMIAGNKVKGVLMDSKLPLETLGKIWDLADQDKDGNLDKHEFTVAIHLVYQALGKRVIPAVLPPDLQKPSRVTPTSAVNDSFGGGGFVANFPTDIAPPPAVPPLPAIMTQPTRMSPALPVAMGSAPLISTDPIVPISAPIAATAASDWVVTPMERIRFENIFRDCDKDKDGLVSGLEVKSVFLQSGVPQNCLAHIWRLCDTNQTGKLTLEQFALAMWLVEQKMKGIEPPDVLKPNMIPPSIRGAANVEMPVVQPEPKPTYSKPELEMISKEIEELARERRVLETDIAQKEADIRIKSGEVRSLQSELDTLAVTLKQLENQKGEAQKRLDDLKSQRIEVNDALSSVNNQIGETQIQVNKIREQCQKQEATINEQEDELNSKKCELQKLKDEETALEKEYEMNRREFDNLTKQLQDTQLQISQVKAMVTQLLEAQRQMTDALLLCAAAIEPDFDDAKRAFEKKIETAPQQDDFTPSDAFGGRSNGFESDPFAKKSESVFDDSFSNAPLSGFDDAFGGTSKPSSTKDPFGGDPDPFGDKTVNAVTPDPSKDDFGSDPFAILHAPTSANQALTPNKSGPPPRPESPSPALPPDFDDAKRAFEKKIETAPQQDVFTPSDAFGGRSNGFESDPFAKKSESVFDDSFSNAPLSGFDDAFGGTFKPSSTKDPFGGDADPFGDKTVNAVTPDPSKDDFGSDPFAILHAPTSANQALTPTKPGPPPRPESPSPALPPDFDDAKRAFEKKIETAPQQDVFTPSDAFGGRSNGFESDPFAKKSESVFDDSFSNAPLSGFDDAFGGTFKPSSTKDPFGGDADPFGDKTVNAVTPDPSKDDFGSDPFAILHAPTSANQALTPTKPGPPPRPESPSPALPPDFDYTKRAFEKKIETAPQQVQKRPGRSTRRCRAYHRQMKHWRTKCEAMINKIREQSQKQEATINEQEDELNSKKCELQKLKDEKTALEKEYEMNRREFDNLTKQLQDTQLQISQVKGMVTQLLEAQRQMTDALLLCKAAIEPDFDDAKRAFEKKIETSPQQDAFTPSDAFGGRSNGFESDPFAKKSESVFDDSFSNAPLSGFDDAFGGTFKPSSTKDPFGGDADPFGDKTVNAVTPDPSKDDFGSDPFAILHAPTSANQGLTPTKSGPPPRPESPSPALPPDFDDTKRAFEKKIETAPQQVQKRPRRSTRRRRAYQRQMKHWRTECEATVLYDHLPLGDVRPFASITLLGKRVVGLIDTGVSISVIGSTLAREILEEGRTPLKKVPFSIFSIRVADGTSHSAVGWIRTIVEFRGKTTEFEFLIVPNLSEDLYLGADFVKKYELALDLFTSPDPADDRFVRAIEKDVSKHTLTSVQQRQVDAVVAAFPSFSREGLGRTTSITHVIDLGDAKTIKQRHYPLSPAVEKSFYAKVDRLMDMGVIEESNSAWPS